MIATRLSLISFGLLLAFERAAVACPFCGGKGAGGLMENLLMVVGLWFGARALWRWTKRRGADKRATTALADSPADPRP